MSYTVDTENIEKAFSYHSMDAEQISRSNEIREKAKELATLIASNCPDSREKSLARTKLEESLMWANKAISHEQ